MGTSHRLLGLVKLAGGRPLVFYVLLEDGHVVMYPEPQPSCGPGGFRCKTGVGVV